MLTIKTWCFSECRSAHKFTSSVLNEKWQMKENIREGFLRILLHWVGWAASVVCQRRGSLCYWPDRCWIVQGWTACQSLADLTWKIYLVMCQNWKELFLFIREVKLFWKTCCSQMSIPPREKSFQSTPDHQLLWKLSPKTDSMPELPLLHMHLKSLAILFFLIFGILSKI